jgi:YD repeat-containing protein
MSSCSWQISCEQGGTSTQFTNETTRYEYDGSGRRTKIIKELSRVVTYLQSGNAYTMSGTIEWDLAQSKVTWNIQVTGGVFGGTAQVCSGSKTY